APMIAPATNTNSMITNVPRRMIILYPARATYKLYRFYGARPPLVVSHPQTLVTLRHFRPRWVLIYWILNQEGLSKSLFNNNSPIGGDFAIRSNPISTISMNSVMRLVYVWMTLGLAVTAVLALFISNQINTAVVNGTA